MATRGQAKRAIAWEQWLAAKPKERKELGFPRCVTCGREADGTYTRGQPRYDCRHEEPFRLDAETLDRARRELGPE